MKRDIDVFEFASEVEKALRQGVLLTTKAGGRVNTMTIGWGSLGVIWGRAVFTAYVREGRLTRALLDENPEFTVNIPRGRLDRGILGFAGSRSGRDADKIAELGLTLEDPVTVSVPAIAELPLTLECKVIYRQPQEPMLLDDRFRRTFYPEGVPSTECGVNEDRHVAYYGEIVAAYIIGRRRRRLPCTTLLIANHCRVPYAHLLLPHLRQRHPARDVPLP